MIGIGMLLVLALASARELGGPSAPLTLGENRLFLGRVHLEGPLDRVRFDCGGAGEVVLRAELARGETREVELPFPLRAPLGLGGVPFPVVESVGGGGVVRFEGWSEEQPGAVFDRLAPGLVSRTRPPAPAEWEGETDGGFAAWALLGLAVAGGMAVVGARRRPAVALVLGSACGGGLLFAPSHLRDGGGGSRLAAAARRGVLEVERGGRAVLVESGDTARLRGAMHLEVEPEGAPLTFWLRLDTDTKDQAHARNASRLTAIFPASEEQGWGAELPAPRSLTRVWTRSPDGSWRERGPWEAGEGLPTAVPDGASDSVPPPGWLVAGLPPGRSVLVGALGPRRWLRLVGF